MLRDNDGTREWDRVLCTGKNMDRLSDPHACLIDSTTPRIVIEHSRNNKFNTYSSRCLYRPLPILSTPSDTLAFFKVCLRVCSESNMFRMPI